VEIGTTFYVVERSEWRAWLQKNHKTEPEIWLVFPNKASGRPRLDYNDAVEEALCFGWIDSIVKKLDPESSAQRFSPRRSRSRLSETNRERIRRLIEQGHMTEAGLEAVGTLLDEPFVIEADVLAALQKDPVTWRNFEAFPESYKRIRIGWIQAARPRQEVFEQRLRYFLGMTAANKRYGMVQ
jgi:uncharacterized protein YdeI (YjbR/CyaY-like superfamily)